MDSLGTVGGERGDVRGGVRGGERGGEGPVVAEYELHSSKLSLVEILEPVFRRLGQEVLCRHPLVAAVMNESWWGVGQSR